MSCMNLKATITIPTVLFLMFLASCSCKESHPANFEGAFDSMAYHSTNSGDEQYEDYSEEGQNYDEEQQDMLEFSQHLGDFVPDETFTFRMKPHQEETFAIWPGASVSSVRGMFHIEVDWDEDTDFQSGGGYADITIMDGPTVARQFKHQRLGVFNHPHNFKDNKFHFNFKSHDVPLEIYFSYEMITPQKAPTKDSNVTDMQKVLNSFTRVSNLLMQQEREMGRLMQIGDKHTTRLKSHLNHLYWRGIVEGLILICSALVSLWMLKRQIYRQYQSLV